MGCAAWRAGAGTGGAGGAWGVRWLNSAMRGALPQPTCTAGSWRAATRAACGAGQGPAPPLFWLLQAPQVRHSPGSGAGARMAWSRLRAAGRHAWAPAARQTAVQCSGSGQQALEAGAGPPAGGGSRCTPPATALGCQLESLARGHGDGSLQTGRRRMTGPSAAAAAPWPLGRRRPLLLAALLQEGKEQRCRRARATARVRATCSAAASGAWQRRQQGNAARQMPRPVAVVLDVQRPLCC